MDKNTLSACSKLIEVIKKDKHLAEQLGIQLEDAPSTKRKIQISPVKLKKVRISNPIDASCSSQTSHARSPDENALDPGTSNVGAGIEESNSSGTVKEQDNSGIQDPDIQDDDPNDILENLYSKDDSQFSESDKEDDSSEEDDEDLTVLGAAPEANWAPSKKLMDWFLRVSDLELTKEVLSEISEEFKADDEIDDHFCPPKFSPPLWTAVQSSSADSFKHKSIYKAQENLLLAIKPLLSVAKNAPKEDKSNILKSIQLICNSNLSLNRLRRCMLAPHLKADLRKSLLALPVKHNSFFGDEFGKVADGVIKENSSIEKILIKKTPKSSFPTRGKHSNWGSRSDNNSKPPFRGRGKGFYRGRGRGKFYSPNSQSQNPPSSQKSFPGGNASSSQQ